MTSPGRDEGVRSHKESLWKTPLFSVLTVDERDSLFDSGSIQTFTQRGQIVPMEEQNPEVLFLIAGGVRVYLSTHRGLEFTMMLRRRLGDASVPPVVRRPGLVSVQAAVLSDHSTLFIVPLAALQRMVISNPQGAYIWHQIVLGQLAELGSRIAELAFFNVRERLAHTLADLAEDEPDDTVHMTRQELGTIVGSSQTQIMRELLKLRREGLVHFTGHSQRKIVANDLFNLERYGRIS